MSMQHTVIFIPGLADREEPMIWATKHWKQSGFTPIIHSMNWRNQNENFAIKLNKLLKLIDHEYELGHQVSLVGTSAGGSAVINALAARKNKIHRVVNICGRLRVGETTGFRGFTERTRTSPTFAQSVIECEKNISTLSPQDRKKIMTIHPQFGDELVPAETTTIPGAYNLTIPTTEHMFSISLALTLFSSRIIKFIKPNL